MLIEEFEKLTGFYPSQSLYRVIEDVYTEGTADKDEFCDMYKKNTDGFAERIARRATVQEITVSKNSEETISDLKKRAKELEERLYKEQEWKPYEFPDNVCQADYEKLRSCAGTLLLSDDEAKDIIAREFGFERSKITIHHSVAKMEINRHRYIHKTGDMIERLPLYNATDWNYIRFDCACNYYEMHNGHLVQFYC